MIIHAVTFKLRHRIDSPEEKAFLKAAMALAKLPKVMNFQCYKQISKKNSFDYGLSMTFASQQDYENYNSHPEHIKFVQDRWLPEVDDFLELDYVEYRGI